MSTENGLQRHIDAPVEQVFDSETAALPNCDATVQLSRTPITCGGTDEGLMAAMARWPQSTAAVARHVREYLPCSRRVFQQKLTRRRP